MQTLFLLRHAKAVPGSGSLQDPDRPLSDQGRTQARRMGNYFKEQKFELDLVLSSTALRARETTELFLKAAECVTEVYYDQRIYEASRHQLLKVLAEIDQDKSNVLLVGHNPVLEELLRHLTGRFESMATGTLAKIDFEAADWIDPAETKGHLDWLIKQAELP
jgi:phosphohistidine phosphatase